MADIENIAEGIRGTNKQLRNRTIFVFFVMFITVVLLSYRMDLDRGKNEDIERSIDFLETMLETKDLPAFLKENDLTIQTLYHVDHKILLYRLKHANFEDRMPIVDNLKELKEQYSAERKAKDFFDQSTSLQGITIPLMALVFIAPFILMVLFHDTVWVIEHRRVLLKEAKRIDMPEWQKGPGLLGHRINPKQDVIFYISWLIDLCISIAVLFSPIVTGLACVKLYSYFTTNLGILSLQLIFIGIIAVDTFIVLYRGVFGK